ncbi:MAG: SHOCT domain-containing protein [Candidatus Binatia bacterium]
MTEGMGLMMTGGILSFLLALILIAVLIGGLVAAVRWLRGEKTPFTKWSGENALDVLKKRYAGGEISKEEFERVRKEIE